jgi:Tol biopolymer transport system component
MLPPSGGKMIFTSFADSAEIYSNLDGSERITLLKSGTKVNEAYEPVGLTGDGKRIFYFKRGASDSLLVGNPDHSGIVVLGVAPHPMDVITVSPDGTRIAYFQENGDLVRGDIVVVGVDGSGSHSVATNTELTTPPRIDWSPDGTRILFASSDVKGGSYYGDLFVVNTDGTGLKNLTNDSLDQVCGAWSPDGTKIAFTQGGPTYDLLTMNADGTGRSVIVGGAAMGKFYPQWSPDGASILFNDGEKIIVTGPGGVNIDYSRGGACSVVNIATRAVSTIAPAISLAFWIR